MSSSYEEARASLRAGRMVVCVPGALNGRRVVSTHSWPADRRTMPLLFDRDHRVRACFLFGVCQVAHEQARERGMVT